MAALVRGLLFALALNIALTFSASAETVFALSFPAELPYWTTPPDSYGMNPFGHIKVGMRLCAKSAVVTSGDLRFRQLIIAHGKTILINTSEGYPGGVHNPSDDQKCRENASLYAQRSNPQYAQVLGPAESSALSRRELDTNVAAAAPPPIPAPPLAPIMSGRPAWGMQLPTGQYDSQGRRIIRADRQGNISAADQAFIASGRERAAAMAPCPLDHPAYQAARQDVPAQQPAALELARTAEANGNLLLAYELLFPLSRQGNAEAEYQIGKILESGKVPQLRPVSGATVICLKLAALQGHIRARTSYAVDIKAEFGKPTYAFVFGLFKDSANHGDPEAEYNLGVMYDEGQGVEKNKPLALQWLRKAVAGGDDEARQRLALVEQEASGVFSIRDLGTIVGAYSDNLPKFKHLYRNHPFAFDGFLTSKIAMEDASDGYLVTFNPGSDSTAMLGPLLFGTLIGCININDEAEIDRVNDLLREDPSPRITVHGTIIDADGMGHGLRLYNCTMNRL